MKKEMYLKIRKPSLRYDYFLFFDTPEYLADQLFIKQKVRVWFDKEYAPFLLRLANQFVYLVADGSRFQINHTAGVFSIAQDGVNGAVLP